MRLQVYVTDELGARIEAQARKDRRSVSEWVALFLEDRLMVPTMEITEGAELVQSSTATSVPKACLHSNTKREKAGASGLIMTKCLDCGGFLKV